MHACPSLRSLLRRTAAPLAISLALGGCTTVGPDFERPAASAAPGYAAAGESGPALQQVQLGEQVAARWWEYFASPELDQVMRLAIENSPSLQAADATLAGSRAEILAARAESAPQVNGNAGVTGQRLNLQSFGFDTSSFEGLENNPTFALYSIGASVSYALDPWGLNLRQVESAAARAEVLQHQADAAYLSLTGNVALQAARIAAIRGQIAAVEQILADDRRLIDLARKANEAGAESDAPRVNAQAQLAADEARLPQLRQDLAAARHALAVLVGKSPSEWTAPDFDLARLTLPRTLPVSLPSDLVRQRPDILAAEARVHEAVADVGVATAALYPRLDLTATLTQSALSIPSLFKPEATAASLGAALAGPLYDGGRRRARRTASEATARAALARYQETVVQAFGQVADLLQALAHDEEALAAQTRARDSADATLRLARAAYEGGATGIGPVIDAERQLNAARLGIVGVEAQRYIHTVQLFAATGTGLREAPASRT